jgi:hypothetical protein
MESRASLATTLTALADPTRRASEAFFTEIERKFA